MIAALAAAREQKARFLRHLHDAAPPRPSEEVSFADYFAEAAPAMARNLALRVGVVDGCERRGIPGLLELRSVRMSVGASLSYNYAYTREGLAQPGVADPQLLHAVSAAAVAETFVTDDTQLQWNLARVSLENFAVIDLPTFLREIH